VPLQFSYFKNQGKENEEVLLSVMESFKPEANSVTSKFNSLRPGTAENALQSQALLQLKKEYCDKKRCLHCALGVKFLQKERQV
jgi:hypothetical protein